MTGLSDGRLPLSFPFEPEATGPLSLSRPPFLSYIYISGPDSADFRFWRKYAKKRHFLIDLAG